MRRGHWFGYSFFPFLILWGSIVETIPSVEAQPFFVATPKAIMRVDDAGNAHLFFDPTEADSKPSLLADVAVSRSGAVYAIESKRGVVWKLQDQNNDGDAHDSGEAIIFRNEKAQGVHLKSPLSIAVGQIFDRDGVRDVVYVYDPLLQATVKLEDIDANGEAQGANEICLLHQNTADKPLTALRMTVDDAGRLLAVNANLRGVVRIVDHNRDCTASVVLKEAIPSGCSLEDLFSEYSVTKDDAGVDPDLVDPFGIAVTGQDVMFVSDWPQKEKNPAAILRLQDLTRNEDAQDAGEVTLFSAGSCEEGKLTFSTPTSLVVDQKGALYVADFDLGMLLKFEDQNGDQDATDPGECRVFAKDFDSPLGLAIQPPPLPPLAINLKKGIEDLVKGSDLLLPEGGKAKFSVEVLEVTTDKPVANAKVVCDPLGACLQCTPHAGRTNKEGQIAFEVFRLSDPTGVMKDSSSAHWERPGSSM